MGVEAHTLEKSLYHALAGDTPAGDILLNRGDGIALLPSSLDMSGADIELSGVAGRETLLRGVLQGIGRGYDFVLIDCPPSLGVLTLNALVAVREVFIPLQTEYLALQGMSKLLDTVAVVKGRLNPALEITGIIACRFDGRKNLCNEVVEKIRGHFGRKVFNTMIRDNIALAECPSFGKTIFEYRPGSHGAEDYRALAREVLKRGSEK